MHCTKCGNILVPGTNQCKKCGYSLTKNEYDDEVEIERKKYESTHKPKRVVHPKESSSKVTIIKDETRDNSGFVSNSRFLGYFSLLVADFSLMTSIWSFIENYETKKFIMPVLFVILSIAFLLLGIYIIKTSGLTVEHLSKHSTMTAILGLLISLIAFILLLTEMSQNNLLLICISIGILIVGVILFAISVILPDNKSKTKK